MDIVRIGIIGLGNMGYSHVKNYLNGKLKNVRLTAVCDIDPLRLKSVKDELNPDVKAFISSDDLIRSGGVDAIVIATPHYYHPTIAIDAFKNGLNVLTEKPAGVYTKAVHEMNDAAAASGKVFGIMYNQRTNPAYRRLKKAVDDGELGEITRLVWIITDWYRTQAYYNSGGWRATWAGEGGGVLLNQCPHQIDIMQWICGMPKRVFAKADFGRFHDIEVEDSVTALLEYENGATGMFMTTTGEFPGTNRFEIAGDLGKAVIEGGKLQFYRNSSSVKEHTKDTFSRYSGPTSDLEETVFSDAGEQHVGIFNNFIDCILYGKPLIAPGEEGIKGLSISNAMHLSAWTGGWVDIPFDEDRFYDILKEKIATSTYLKPLVDPDSVGHIEGTYSSK